MNRISRLGVFVFSMSMAAFWLVPVASADDIPQIGGSDALELARPLGKTNTVNVREGRLTSRHKLRRSELTVAERREMSVLRSFMVAGYVVSGVSIASMVGEYGFTGSIKNTTVAVVPAVLGLADVIVCHSRRSAIKDRVRSRSRASVDVGLLLIPDKDSSEHAARREKESVSTGVYAKFSFRW